MRRLSMKNKRRKSESASDNESKENGGARASTDNAGNGETQAAGRNNNLSAMRKGATKRRSLRGAPVQKSAAHADDSVETDDSAIEPEKERENGEKSAGAGGGHKTSPNKRRKKEDQESTSAHEADKSGVEEEEYEVEKLINVRTSKGHRQFLVRWKGYGESADTWENEKDLNCAELIEEFLAKEQETKSKTGSTKTDKSKKSKGSPKKETENDEQNNKDDKETLKEFEVEKIIEVRFKKNGTREFLIRWKGFSPVDDTWEPEKNLNCEELITKFMQKVEKAKTQEMRELRTNRVHTKRYTLTTRDSGRRLSKRNKDKQRTTYHECDE